MNLIPELLPTTVEQMATAIYLMEIGEWGVESREDLRVKLARESFAAARTFFKVASEQPEQYPKLRSSRRTNRKPREAVPAQLPDKPDPVLIES